MSVDAKNDHYTYGVVGGKSGESAVSEMAKYASSYRPVSITDEELQLRKLTAAPLAYEDLTSVDKTLFFNNLDKVRVKDYYPARYDQGLLIMMDGGYNGAKREGFPNLVWPDLEDENLKKEIAKYFLTDIRKGRATSYSEGLIAQVFLGSEWRTEISAYGNRATEADIRTAISEFWPGYAEEKGFAIADDEQAYYKMPGKGIMQLNILKAMHGKGDNIKEVEEWVNSFVEETMLSMMQKRDQAAAERERKEQDEIRNHVLYKEVPKNIADSFSKIGITLKYNNTDIHGTRRREEVHLKSFQCLLIHDKHAKNGKLCEAKDTLKTRYKANWISGVGGDFGGELWWHVPASTPLTTLYDIING